jgi:adenine C2-methylase RlmN of 23S rRNA A2503 and tRNA A37
MGCTFCATGMDGLARDLSPGEMVDQVNVVAEDFGRRVTNVVAMGQGEPFVNYDAVLGALRFMNSENGPGIGARHITVSTCGLTSGIRRFAEEPENHTRSPAALGSGDARSLMPVSATAPPCASPRRTPLHRTPPVARYALIGAQRQRCRAAGADRLLPRHARPRNRFR